MCGPTSCRIAARALAESSAVNSATNSWRPMASGRLKASRTPTAPGSSFRWFRSRIEGGRTNHWGRIALRFGPADFRARSTDGMGDDWPITYEELAPYYDKVESYIGVFGSKENVPNAPDGVFMPPPRPRCTETMIKKACDQLNITCIPSRLAILTKDLNGRDACHYCAQCGRGCRTASNFSSSQVMIPPATATGRLHDDCQCDGPRNRDGQTAEKRRRCRTSTRPRRANSACMPKSVVVAASACESARLLLNSRSASFSDWAGEFVGSRRTLSDRFGRQRSGRVLPAAWKYAGAQP